MRGRSGFTLVELLVATAVFVIGFTAVFGLFLVAMRFRTLADDSVKLSLAASSIVAELSVGDPAVPAPVAPAPGLTPADYLGAGQLPVPLKATDPKLFYAYPGVPGSWYTVETCTDVAGSTTNDKAPTLHVSLLVVMFPQVDPATGLSFKDLCRRLRLDVQPMPADLDNLTPEDLRAISDALIKRGIALRVAAVVLRRPTWM